MSMIYHITSRNTAFAAHQAGEYRSPSLEGEGFIHFSQLHQVLGVANAFYAGQTDLVILVVDESRLISELKYEEPVHPTPSTSLSIPAADQKFPHLYGPLNFEAVVAVVELPNSTGGSFELPAALEHNL